MSLNRKDTILIAVLMNVGLLVILCITAISFEDDSSHLSDNSSMMEETFFVKELPPTKIEAPVVAKKVEEKTVLDQLDSVAQVAAAKPPVAPPAPAKESPAKPETEAKPQSSNFVEITVKRGDSLDRLARANKTTIKEIKKLNGLQTDRLRIGQVLKIPLPSETAIASKSQKSSESAEPSGAVFYELKSGDNPWKVAKKFEVGYEEIIELNQLTDNKARALKPGDKIRIK